MPTVAAGAASYTGQHLRLHLARTGQKQKKRADCVRLD
jgi:hypothetical protein